MTWAKRKRKVRPGVTSRLRLLWCAKIPPTHPGVRVKMGPGDKGTEPGEWPVGSES